MSTQAQFRSADNLDRGIRINNLQGDSVCIMLMKVFDALKTPYWYRTLCSDAVPQYQAGFWLKSMMPRPT